jgi:RND family efflux transporter MFP subunit
MLQKMKRTWRNRWSARGIVSASILLLGCGSGCSRETPPVTDPIRPIKTHVVTAGDDARTRVFSATVEASRRVELAFQVPGVLLQFPVREGQAIAKGELIGQLRPDEFQARLTSLQGELDQSRATLQALRAGERAEERRRREAQVRAAEARLANARTELDRAARLLPNRAISQAEYERLATNYQVAQEELKSTREQLEAGLIGREEDIMAEEARVRSLEGRVVEANIQLRDTRLIAPYDGVIARRFVEEGQNIRAKEPIVRFQDIEEIEIVVDVPETVMAADIQSADIVEMVAELSGAPGVRFPVQIREIAQVADPTTQTFKVRTAMQAPAGVRALPGMTATVMVTYRRARVLGNRTLIPIGAVFKDPAGKQLVWVIGPESTIIGRDVQLGEPAGGQIEIIEGLQPGDRIAVAGVKQLRDGMRVRDLGDALGGGRP